MQQQQQINNCIDGLVQMLTTYSVPVPADLVNPNGDDESILDRLLELVQDNNLEYEMVGSGAVLKSIVKQSYLCQSQLRSKSND